eukprot:3786878-Amphidinium_carterae.1
MQSYTSTIVILLLEASEAKLADERPAGDERPANVACTRGISSHWSHGQVRYNAAVHTAPLNVFSRRVRFACYAA